MFGNCRVVHLRFARRKVTWLTWATAIGALSFVTSCNRGAAEGAQGPPVMPVKVEQVGPQELGNASEYVATIRSRNSATIMSDVEGWIFAIRVKSGEVVT